MFCWQTLVGSKEEMPLSDDWSEPIFTCFFLCRNDYEKNNSKNNSFISSNESRLIEWHGFILPSIEWRRKFINLHEITIWKSIGECERRERVNALAFNLFTVVVVVVVVNFDFSGLLFLSNDCSTLNFRDIQRENHFPFQRTSWVKCSLLYIGYRIFSQA